MEEILRDFVQVGWEGNANANYVLNGASANAPPKVPPVSDLYTPSGWG
jgi:hypothetical protein